MEFMKQLSGFWYIRCSTLFEKSNFCPKIQFWQNPNIFTSFSSKFFLTIFLVKSKLSTAKKSKTTTFSRVFHPKKSTIFSGNQSWIFGQKMKISNSVRRLHWKLIFLYRKSCRLLRKSSLGGSGACKTTSICSIRHLHCDCFKKRQILLHQRGR